ncbi:hypothetical protein INT45_002600, partial [Circinella minor]
DDEEMINVTQELDNNTIITPSPAVTIDNVAVTLSATFAEKTMNPSAFSLPEAEQKVAAMMLRLRFPHQEKIDPTPD